MNAAAREWVPVVVGQLWQVTAVALAVGLVTRVFCRQRPHLAYLLWMLAIVKCLTPPLWSSPTGIFGWAQLGRAAPPAAVSAQTAISAAPIEPLPRMFASDDSAIEHGTQRIGAQAPTGAAQSVSLYAVLSILWLAGVGLLGAWVVLNWLRLHRLARRGALAADGRIAAMAAELCRAARLRRRVRVRVIDPAVGPAVFGLFRPTVLLPSELFAQCSTISLRAILAHEISHVRRWDTLAAALQVFAQVMWWFHPLVWWANRQACRARERCCDEEAIAGLGCKPAEYAASLLEVLELRRGLKPILGVPGLRPVQVTSRRLEQIMQHAKRFHRRTPRWCWAALAAGALVVLPGRAIPMDASGVRPGQVEAAATTSPPTKDGVQEHRNRAQPDLEEKHTAAAANTQETQQSGPGKPALQAADVQAEAVAALERLGAKVERNDQGEVVRVTAISLPGAADSDLAYLKAFSKLERFEVYSTRLSDAGLEHLEQLDSLKQLRIDRGRITDRGLAHLEPLKNLELLHVHSDAITDAGLRHLEMLPNLAELLLYGAKITDDGMARLARLPRLNQLYLQNIATTDTGVAQLAKAPHLQWLILSGARVTDAGLASLAVRSDWKGLALDDGNITDAGLEPLQEMADLEWLGLENTHVSDDGLAALLPALPPLRMLYLNGTKITDKGLQLLKDRHSLESLGLSKTRITDAGLRGLEGLTNLQMLQLNDTPVSDEGLRHLSKMSQMEVLMLNRTQVSDAGLASLEGLSHLVVLDVMYTEVTVAGARRLSKSLPECSIQVAPLVQVKGKLRNGQ